MSFSFYKDAKDGDTVTLANGARYQYQEAKNRWVVKSVQEEDECPRFDAIATQYKDLSNPKEQVAINYLQHGQQEGSQGFSEVRLCNFLREIDTSNGWISIDGNKHLIHRVDTLGGDPLIQLVSSEGDLSPYIGNMVVVHSCEEA